SGDSAARTYDLSASEYLPSLYCAFARTSCSARSAGDCAESTAIASTQAKPTVALREAILRGHAEDAENAEGFQRGDRGDRGDHHAVGPRNSVRHRVNSPRQSSTGEHALA